MDELLKKFGLKYEDLNAAEVETLNSWLSALQQKSLTLEKVREYIASLRDAVQNELVNEPEVEYYFFGFLSRPSRKSSHLKARLRNYMLLDAFLISPEKARKSLEAAVSGIAAAAG